MAARRIREKPAFLPLANQYLFPIVMERNPDLCRQLIEVVLDIEIASLELVEAERSHLLATARSVRCDVVAKESGRTFDVELQMSRDNAIGKRMRYYQAAIDTKELEKGSGYDEMGELYIIFLCKHDPFGRNKALYRFDALCVDDPSLSLGSGFHAVVAVTQAFSHAESPKLRALLEYLESGTSDAAANRLVAGLDAAVRQVNEDEELIMGVMTYEMDLAVKCKQARREGREEGRKEGRAEGRKEGRAEGREEMLDKLVEAGLVGREAAERALAVDSKPAKAGN